MRKTAHKYRKHLSVLLMLAILLPAFSAPAIALESEPLSQTEQSISPAPDEASIPSDDTVNEATPPEIATMVETMEFVGEEIPAIQELPELREENVKHFKMTDGTYCAVSYTTSVHRKDSQGVWQDIDNNLKLQATKNIESYTNGRTTFAKSFTENETLFTLSENGYTISLSLNADKFSSSDAASSARGESKVTLSSHKVRKADDDFNSAEEAAEINNRASILYTNVKSNTDLEYVLIGNDVKENIIVKAKRENYDYEFTLTLIGLTAQQNEDGSISLLSEGGKREYLIPVPYMYDAEGALSYAVSYTLKPLSDGSYTLRVSADETWINAKERVFPVTVDPTIKVEASSDTYIDSGAAGTNYGTSSVLRISPSHMTYISAQLPNLPEDAQLNTVTFMYPYDHVSTPSSSASDYVTTVGIYRINRTWNGNTLTWNMANGWSNYGLATTATNTQALTTTYSESTYTIKWAQFDVTSLASQWYANTTNYGIALKYVSGSTVIIESQASESLSGPYPYFSVKYTHYIPDGVYSIRNVANTNYYMTVGDDSIWKDGVMQQEYAATNPVSSFDRSSLFKISRVPGTDRYVIRSMLNNNLTFKIVNTKVQTKMISSDDTKVATGDTFCIEWHPNGFSIRQYNSVNLVAAPSTSVANLTKVSKTNVPNDNAGWTLTEYTGADKTGVLFYKLVSWTDIGIVVRDVDEATLFTWSTSIGYDTPFVELPAGYDDMGELSWNASTKVATITFHTPGATRLLVGIRNTAGSTLYSGYYNFHVVPQTGIYYIQNAASRRYVDVEGPYTSEGTNIQQWDYHSGTQLRWTLEHVVGSNGYVRLKSVYSNLYLGVNSANTAQIKQYSTQNNYTLWKIDRTSAGNLKLTNKATESSGKVLSIPLTANANGTDLTQIAYTNDTNYRDEWYFYVIKDASFIALPAPYDRTSFFSGALEDLASIGYTDTFDNHETDNMNNYGTIALGMTEKELLDRMKFSKITVIRTHGTKTNIQASDQFLCRDDLLSLPNNTLSYAELVIYGACLTAEGGENDANLVAATVDAGARTAIGFENPVEASACNEWIEKFFEFYITYSQDDSKTINDVCEATRAYARNHIRWYEYTKDDGVLVTLERYVICGEETFP